MAINGGVFGTVQIGDYAFVVPSSNAQLAVETIPRAQGTIIKFMGGGTQNLSLNAWVVNFAARRRKELEEFFRDLEASLIDESPATLTVNEVVYEDCFYSSFSAGGSSRHFDTFEVQFVRSSTGSVC